MPRLLLHVGWHKTGTTAIQSFAAHHRSALLKRGLWYPDYQPASEGRQQAHHAFAGGFAGEGFLSSEQARALIDYWVENADKSKHLLLLSAETISRLVIGEAGEDWLLGRRRYLQTLREALSPFDVDVIVVLRRQDHYVLSMYQEYIFTGPRGVNRWIDADRSDSLLPLSFQRFRGALAQTTLRYRDSLLLFEELFGRPKMMLYQELAQTGQLAGAFFHELGLNTQGLADPGVVHPSPSYEETVLKRTLWPLAALPRANAALNRFLVWAMRNFFHPSFGASPRDRLWEKGRAWFDFLDDYYEENAAIAARYFPLREGPLFE